MKTKQTLLYLYYLLCGGVRYMFRPLLGHHQESCMKNKVLELRCLNTDPYFTVCCCYYYHSEYIFEECKIIYVKP
jgi:hypothetical protein